MNRSTAAADGTATGRGGSGAGSMDIDGSSNRLKNQEISGRIKASKSPLRSHEKLSHLL